MMMKSHKKMFYFGPSFEAALVREESFTLPSVCRSLKGRTLLFVSDVHLCRRFPLKALRLLVQQMSAVQPDMLLLGGDYAENAEWQRQFFEEISCIRPPLGSYAVLGNNDTECFPKDVNELAKIAAGFGVTLLNNQAVRISVGADTVCIAGLDDFKHGSHPMKPLFKESDLSSLRILLSHYPQGIAYYTSRVGGNLQPHLALSGHTHGGQFSLRGFTPFSIGFERRIHGMALPAVSGWTDVGQTKLLVSSGIGTSRLPFRLCVPPEIHRISL